MGSSISLHPYIEMKPPPMYHRTINPPALVQIASNEACLLAHIRWLNPEGTVPEQLSRLLQVGAEVQARP